MIKGHPLKGCLFYFPNKKLQRFIFGNMKSVRGGTRSQLHGRVLPGARHLTNGKKSEGELAHSCEGRCSPSGSPLSATLKRKMRSCKNTSM